MSHTPHVNANPALDPDPAHRRAPLTSSANPAPRLDYRVTLSARLTANPGPAGGARITVDYIPDRLLLDPAGLSRYMTGLSGLPWSGPEALGVAILDDINNEIVPRWVRVTIHATHGGGEDTAVPSGARVSRPSHRVILEDRQPHWDEGMGAGLGDAPAQTRRG